MTLLRWCQVNSGSVTDGLQTTTIATITTTTTTIVMTTTATVSTTTTSAAYDAKRASSLSALRLSEIDVKPVVNSQNATTSSTDNTDIEADAPAKSAVSHLSEESDLSTSSDTQDHVVDSVPVERPAVAAEADTDARNSRPPLLRSRPASIISQSSLPEKMSFNSRDDKDLSATVSFCTIIVFVVWESVMPVGRLVLHVFG